jgi:hypothetical protein
MWNRLAQQIRGFFQKHPLTETQQWEAWQKDFARIYTETVYVFQRRLIFREIMRMFQNNPELQRDSSVVWDYLHGTYGRDMVLAVGRELDRHTETINLIQLMYQITKRPRVISRARFFKLLNLPAPRPGAIDGDYLYRKNQEWFTQNFGAGEYLAAAHVKRDRNWLEKRCKTVMKYRHKMVAHRTEIELSLTVKHVDHALDAIEVILKKYHVLFTGGGLVGAEPTIQGNWMRPFRFPWFVN